MQQVAYAAGISMQDVVQWEGGHNDQCFFSGPLDGEISPPKFEISPQTDKLNIKLIH